MALIERETVKIDHILDDGRASIRKGTQLVRVNDDGAEEIVNEYDFHRHVLDVGDDVTNEPQIVKDFANGIHTPERKAARDAIKAAQAVEAVEAAPVEEEPILEEAAV